MLLSHRTSLKICPEYSNIIGHMCYAASKLWNVCNYERHHYKELGLEKYPDWYYQKKAHKGDLWYRQLPSQTAQETCKQLDKAWKSFYVLKKTGGIKEPNPPRFKQDNIPVTYMQMGIRHEKGSDQLRLSLPKDLKSYMEETYGIHEKFLYLENKIFRNMDHIKQLRIYPPENGKCDLIVIYEIEEPEQISQNGHYLSIDLGLHNLMTCYDSGNGYYKQEDDKLVCQNCGNSFTMDQVGETAGGCNPWPILESDWILADGKIQISYDFLKDSADIFANWKGAYQS